MPDLRIVDDGLWQAVRAELARRQGAPVAQRRNRHLLSGLIRCGSNYTISSKTYYRCAGIKERGTCDNTVSIRKGPIETAVLSVLQSHLLTPDHGRLFVEEFKREMARLTQESERGEDDTAARLKAFEAELHKLSQNMLAGVLSPTLTKMLAEHEAEQAALKARLERVRPPRARRSFPPGPAQAVRGEGRGFAGGAQRRIDPPAGGGHFGVADRERDDRSGGEDGPEAELVAPGR